MLTTRFEPARYDHLKLADELGDRGISPAQLARMSELSRETISNCLSGERHNPNTWRRIARALGKTPKHYRLPRSVEQ